MVIFHDHKIQIDLSEITVYDRGRLTTVCGPNVTH